MKYHFKIYAEEKGFWAQCLELPGCVTQGESKEELFENMQDALNTFLTEPKDSKFLHPYPDNSIKIKDDVIEVPIDPVLALSMQKVPISLNQKAITEFCNRHHILSLSLFGSILTNSFHSKSDVDVLVKFDRKKIPSLFTMIDIEEELSSIIGRKVDLRTENDLSSYFRKDVTSSALAIYEK